MNTHQCRTARAVQVVAAHWQRATDPAVRTALHAALVEALPDTMRDAYAVIEKAPDGLAYAEIAVQAGISAIDVSSVVLRLKALGLVRRSGDGKVRHERVQ